MAFIELFDDPSDTKKIMIAVQKSVVRNFSDADWKVFAYENSAEDFILGHRRLLRSLSWEDEDYASCVFEVLNRLSIEHQEAFMNLVLHVKVRQDVENSCASILHRVGIPVSHVGSVTTNKLNAPEVVVRALLDAEELLKSSGPISCVDRLHTALHGYFRFICERDKISLPQPDSLPALFKALRSNHKELQNLGSQDKDITRVLSGFATVIDAINTIRNNASVAHPTSMLLSDTEALLIVNSVRTLFHYVRSKVKD